MSYFKAIVLMGSLIWGAPLVAASDLPFVLESRAQDGNLKIKLDQKGNKILIHINDGESYERYYSLQKKSGQFGTFSLNPSAHKKFRIYKTNKEVLIKKQKFKVFQLYYTGKKDSVELVARGGKREDLSQGFKEQEFKGMSVGDALKLLKANCGITPKIKTPKDLSLRNYIRGIAKTCNQEKLYKEALSELELIRFSLSDTFYPKFNIGKDYKVLTIQSSKNLFNSYQAIFFWLKDNL